MPFRNRLNNSVANAELIDCTEATAYAFGHGLV
jgi:hypothetical protein